jgi:hypothetical protein
MSSRASEAVQCAFYFFGLGVTNLANMANARLVPLSGAIIDAWPEGMETIRYVATQRVRSVIRDRLVAPH